VTFAQQMANVNARGVGRTRAASRHPEFTDAGHVLDDVSVGLEGVDVFGRDDDRDGNGFLG
jgi:hypothetical protein